MKFTASILTAVFCLSLLAVAPAARAQYSQDFETLTSSPSGAVLTGQDAYVLPPGTTSVDFKCYDYAGNILGIVQNPEGGSKFIAGTGPGDGTYYARAERSVTFGHGIWVLWYDFCGIFTGTPPGTNNLGSFSLRQASANTVHINLLTWVDPNNPTAINSTYVPYDQFGVQFAIPGNPPGPEWANLLPNHWYRARTVVDFDLNMITEVGIRDLSGGSEAVYVPTGWYLYGGASGSGWLTDGIRWFGGGGGPGNTTAWDNAVMELQTTPPPTGACCLTNGSCRVTTQTDCPGTYMGDGTVCDPSPCAPVPVVRSTWGSIKQLYH